MTNLSIIPLFTVLLFSVLRTSWSNPDGESREINRRSIVDNGTSLDTVVVANEGTRVRLTCLSPASGQPPVTITWEKEDGTNFAVYDSRIGGEKTVRRFVRQELTLPNVTRTEMGAYLCTASNKMGERVSKRIQLQVNFAPTIRVKLPRIRVAEGDSVGLECTIEASPKAINYWVKGSDEMIVTRTDSRITTSLEEVPEYSVRMSLFIKDVNHGDYSLYKCVSKNSIGSAKGSIQVYGPESHSDELYHASGDGDDDDDDDDDEHENVSRSNEDDHDHGHAKETSSEVTHETTNSSVAMDTETQLEMTSTTDMPPDHTNDGYRLYSCFAASVMIVVFSCLNNLWQRSLM